MSLYGSVEGNYVTGRLNVGWVAWSPGANPGFNLWAIWTNMYDVVGQQVDLKTIDGLSTRLG